MAAHGEISTSAVKSFWGYIKSRLWLVSPPLLTHDLAANHQCPSLEPNYAKVRRALSPWRLRSASVQKPPDI
jgi:hypothetical protein